MSNIEVARQLIAAMHSDPEVAGEVRLAVPTDELLEVPDRLRQLAEAQTRTEGEIARLSAEVASLSADVARLSEEVARLSDEVGRLVDSQGRLATDVGDLKGMRLELNVSLDPRRYIPRGLATRVRRMGEQRFEELMDMLSDEAADDLLRSEALVEAERTSTNEPLVIVVEVAWTAYVDDVERAERRANHLRVVGISAVPLVISRVDPDRRVLDAAKRRSVAVASESKGLLVPDRPSAA